MEPHDAAQLYRALLSRDSRFDGVFFVGVTSTGIYCRPVCPAPTPRAARCRYFASAAAAERRGFRPCLRCRPELAPGRVPGANGDAAEAVASVDSVERLARTAAARIAAGALDHDGLESLAAELGVSARHLRRCVERTLGAAPVALAQTRRLLTAKQLLTDTDLPVSRVAFASGFSSLRRFNALFREQYRLAPTALRRSRVSRDVTNGDGTGAQAEGPGAETSEASIVLTTAYRPPLHWPALHAYLAGRATPGVEAAGADRGGWYARTVSLGEASGWVLVSPRARRGSTRLGGSVHDHALQVELSTSLLPVLVPLLARLRRQFDLDADPSAVDAHLANDARLAPLVRLRPGLRTPGAFDGAELSVRAVLGQQISVRGATTLAGRLARLLALPAHSANHGGMRPELATLTSLPIDITRLADASPTLIAGIGLTRSRAECLVALARALASNELPEITAQTPVQSPASLVRRLLDLPGIGPWTADYIVMRALQWPDAFPAGDLALRKAMGGLSAARLRAESQRWRPWRAYAAHHLWASATSAPSLTTARPGRRAVRRTSGAPR
jgi:AraC family transcriptional regulator of adaptative response / DNA-3-methyladenine glycosylase II